MNITVKSGNVLREASDLAVLAAFEDAALPDAAAGLLEPDDFRGRAGQTLLLYPRGAVAARRLLLVGLGKRDKVTAESVRRAAATAVRQARELQVAALSIGVVDDLPLDGAATGQALAEGLHLGAYRYWKYRTGLTTEQTFVVESATVYTGDEREADVRAGIATGQIVARGVMFARDLVNSPGYAMTPARMGEEAIELEQRVGLKATVLDKAQLTEQGFGGILAVGQGSANDPRFIIMEYGAAQEGTPTICLVGKGLTFDSGGLSIKPAEAMDTMKSDMGGSAAVFGAMQIVAELGLPLHVVGLVSSAENMPSGTSYRPGDVVTTLSGKTIEVLNTDAEGRIILADALHYAQRYNPAAIVELSTLTGAIIIALGSHATGMVATDDLLAERVSRAGEISGERVWQLPLWQEYHDMIKSEIADLKNIGGREGGSITAGAFLAAFVGDYPFVHLDIAGTAWAGAPSKPYDAHGGTGVGVRLLTEFLRGYAQ
ncbi:putative cytosol aminopeptidase [Candidatus Promineifilum breve]|uniref:Probable cytosol aminopeptidase n=1 Tax=Candidatus Promineifilum breve TaxID=1806508 RepID=A0A160T5N4_9CHLR|nr:leucyl aminopeptidase [Candidatus Promineifilum breve]CUS05132.2 putative cytosol aminopeptidase [Candidatus Promineifilum breve]